MGKRLKSGTSGVAGGLLCVTLALSSCLLPQNDDPLPEIPPAKNRPPRIITPLPERFFAIPVGANCSPPPVSAGVEDLDTRDLIRVKWSVRRADGSLDRLVDGRPGTLGTSMTPIRMMSLVPPSEVFTGVLSSTGSGRRLELIVSDGEFTTDSTGGLTSLPVVIPDGPDGGPIDNITYLDTYAWVVDSVVATCP